MRFLAAALGMAESRQQRLAIEHDGGIRREHEVGQVRHRRNKLDCGAEPRQGAIKGRPFTPRGSDQRFIVPRPA